MRKSTALLIALLAGSWCAEALADPPPHAPAHGWRKKHDPYYIGYTGTRWEYDYDVSTGRCNREEIGAVLGGIAGGVIGSRVASRDHRTVATIIGAAAGALIGAKIGRGLDPADRGCLGHALEIGAPGRRVTWENPATGVSYVLTPGDGRSEKAGTCRSFTLVASYGGQKSKRKGKACQSSIGVWKVV